MKILLYLCLIFIFNSAYASQLDFLENYSKTAILLNQINYESIKSLKDCSCYLLKKANKQNINCADVESTKELTFIKRGINIYGEQIQKTFTCEKIVETMIFKKIRENYKPMHLAMSLLRPEKLILDDSADILTESFSINDLFKGPQEGLEYKINRNPTHLVKKDLVNYDVPLKQPSPLTQAEITESIKMFKQFSYDSCNKILSTDRSRITSKLKLNEQKFFSDASNEDICLNIIESKKGSYTKSRFPEVLYKMYLSRNREFRLNYKEKYTQMVQENPLLLMVSSETPALSEVTDALSFILKNAKKRLSDGKKIFNEKNYEESLKYSNVAPYAKATWKSQEADEAQYDALLIKHMDAYQRKIRNYEYGKTAALFAVTAACILPWGKGVNAAMALLKTSCMVGLGLPLNSYFLVDSFVHYQESLNQYFSYIERAQGIDNAIDQIQNNKDSFLFSALFLPIALEIKNIKKMPELIKQLRN